MLKTTLLSLATIVSAVLAGSVKITSPKPGNVWEIGKEVEITWDKTASGSEPVSILLASGPAQALSIDLVVANKIPVAQGHYKWTVPSTVKPGKKYVVEVGPSMKDLTFAGYISVEHASHKPNATEAHHHHPSGSHAHEHSHHPSKAVHPTAHHHSHAPPHPSGVPQKQPHKKHGKKPKHKASGAKKGSKSTTHKKHAQATTLPSAI
ncbi:hypothetical protein Unana1_02106 [Umbelopsis nana]